MVSYQRQKQSKAKQSNCLRLFVALSFRTARTGKRAQWFLLLPDDALALVWPLLMPYDGRSCSPSSARLRSCSCSCSCLWLLSAITAVSTISLAQPRSLFFFYLFLILILFFFVFLFTSDRLFLILPTN